MMPRKKKKLVCIVTFDLRSKVIENVTKIILGCKDRVQIAQSGENINTGKSNIQTLEWRGGGRQTERTKGAARGQEEREGGECGS